jgi:ADP-ribose pyrophosphatase YjhB (NUDIX family)
MEGNIFNPNPDKKILVHDLFGKKHQRNLKSFKLRASAYGILFDKDQILVQRHPMLKTYGLPGGGMDIGESLEIALKREFMEETGLKIKKDKLVCVTEDFFTQNDQDAQSVLVTYIVRKTGGELLSKGNQEDTAEVKFMKLDDLTKDNVQRVFWPIIKIIKTNKKLLSKY